MHEDDVDGDPMEPRRELRLTAEVLEAPEDLDEDLLDDVLEIRGRVQHPIDEPRYVGTMLDEDLLEGGGIPCSRATQQPLVLRRVRSGGRSRQRGQQTERSGGGHLLSGARPRHDIHQRPLGDGNLARSRAQADAGNMAIVAVTVLLGVVLFDAHDFVNRRTRRL